MNRNKLQIRAAQKSEIATIRFIRGASSAEIQPFIGSDSSAGMEYELQVAVEGQHNDVDLPITIKDSTYYRNIVKRTARGDLTPTCVETLDCFLYKNNTKVWENSWVRLNPERLSTWTKSLLDHDFLADKGKPQLGQRQDLQRFHCNHHDQKMLRIPISYLLKLSLANVLSSSRNLPDAIEKTRKKLLSHLVSDHTSPEVLSFTIPQAGKKTIGRLAGEETARTLLVCQLLIQYANKAFDLEKSGQKCLIYFAPHAPSRQKKLNDIVPDGYYRHLFMSPCLSGWDRGEEKHAYMGLCHKTLSRSQLNTISKLKDAGILTNNLITLPNTSNTCLANNGTHVSLGSRALGALASDSRSGFNEDVEKHCGDLVIKIVEHFLPLFVGTYSAAPYRIDFRDFHPENVLGFLPHELDYTHLRMIWRRWKKKAKIGFLGRSMTPFGPRWLDSLLASTLRLKGDLVPDFRLMDYLATLLSTESSPALNGAPGNQEQLKEELMDMGIFDSRMSIYLLYRQRLFASSGYCGFEGRSYSLFHSLLEDMAEAVDLQNFITALAYRYVLKEQVTHRDIPDIPSVESERRQIFFASAIGIPTFYVRSNTGNRMMQKILAHVQTSRRSNRYRGYQRVKVNDYRLALLKVLQEDGGDLLQSLKMSEPIEALKQRFTNGAPTATSKIISGVCSELPLKKDPFRVSADTFNDGAESYFRGRLRKSHLREGLNVLIDDCLNLDKEQEKALSRVMGNISPEGGAGKYVADRVEDVISERADVDTLQNLLYICLTVIHNQQQQN